MRAAAHSAARRPAAAAIRVGWVVAWMVARMNMPPNFMVSEVTALRARTFTFIERAFDDDTRRDHWTEARDRLGHGMGEPEGPIA